MPRCQPASPRRFTRGLVPPRLCLFVCAPVFRQRQQALPAILFPLRISPTWRPPRHPSANTSYLEAASVIHPQQPDHTSHRVCEFLLPGGRQRHPSRAARSHQPLCLEPLPFPELEPDGCLRPLPFPGHEPGGCLEPLPFPKLNPEDVLNLCPSQSLNPKGALNLCPSQSWNPPVVTVSGTSKSRHRPYRSPPTNSLHNYYWSFREMQVEVPPRLPRRQTQLTSPRNLS